MKINYFRRRKKTLMPDTKPHEQEDLGVSSFWDANLDAELTNKGTDDKMKPEKEILTFNREGEINKVPENKVRKLKLPRKSLDWKYLNVGYYILIPIIGGLGLGVYLDNYFGTKPILIGIFLFLGTIAGFYNLFKLLKE